VIYNKSVRIAFYVLLFANLAYLAWSQWVDVPASAAVAASRSKLARLVLVDDGSATSAAGVPGAEHGPSLAQCISVGPFDDVPSAAHGADVLRKKGFDSRQRTQPAIGADGYWVYVGGLTTPDVAKLALQSLRNDGIKEATAIQPSEDERRISVGLFTERGQADRRVQEVRKLGLKAEMVERKLPSTLYWVDVAVNPQDGVLPAQDLYRGPSSRIGARPCPDGSTLPGATPNERANPPERRPGQRSQATAVASLPNPH
jgi:hypothetical protein